MMAFVYDLKELRGEEFVWRKMMSFGTDQSWTIVEVDGTTRSGERAPHEYLRRLIRGGFVVEAGFRDVNPPSKIKAKLYRIIQPRQAAPRLDRNGNELPERVIDTLWRTMKMLKRFTPQELATHASTDQREIKTATAERYARELAAVGVITRLASRSPTYLITHGGAAAPRVLRRHVVFDPNTLTIIGEAAMAEEVLA